MFHIGLASLATDEFAIEEHREADNSVLPFVPIPRLFLVVVDQVLPFPVQPVPIFVSSVVVAAVVVAVVAPMIY